MIRNINNFKTLTNNISSSYWTRNIVCREEQKRCRNQKQCSQDENKFTDHKFTDHKIKTKNKNNYQIKIITKIYYIIVKKIDMQNLYQNHYIFMLKYLKHWIFHQETSSMTKKMICVHTKYSKFWWDLEFQ